MSFIKALINRRDNKKKTDSKIELDEANLSNRARTNLAHDRKKKLSNKYV